MKRFLLQVLASTLGVAIALFALFTLVFSAFSDEIKPRVPDGAWLVLDDTLAFTERGTVPTVAALLVDGAEPALPLRKLIGAVDAAAADPRIEGIAMYASPWHNGWAGLSELRGALLRFRAAGKPVLAFAPSYDEAGWYLATAADEITLAPLGMLEIDGLAAELMFFAEAMEKAGIEVQVTRVGRYKSAVEPFLERTISEANREQVGELLEDIYAVFLADAAEARGMDAETLRALSAVEGILTSERAAALALVDRVAAFDVFLEDLESRAAWDDDAGTFLQIGIRDWLGSGAVPDEGVGSLHVAVLYAEGEILDGESEDQVGGDTLARELRAVRWDEDVDAVVLRVDSPGGSASASEVILREMQLLRDVKPVVVSMGGVAASGGYWIACQADLIYAHPQTVTGSIGVFGMFPNVAGLLEKLGVHVDVVKNTETADLFSPLRSKAPGELDRAQVWVDEIYDGFLDRVANGRGLPRERVAELADGRVWSCSAALEHRLVDRLGTLNDAIEAAARAVADGPYTVEYWEPVPDPIDAMLFGVAGFEDFPLVGAGATAGWLPPELQPLFEAGRRVLAADRRGAVQARLPYTLRLR